MKPVGVCDTWRRILPPVGDLAICYFALFTSLFLRNPELMSGATAAAFAPLFLVFLAIMYALGLYELRLLRDTVALVSNLLISSAVCLAVGFSYFYLAKSNVLMPKTHLIIIVALSHAVMLLWRRAWLWLLDFHVLDQRIVFLGDAERVREIEEAILQGSSNHGFSPVPWQWPGVDMIVADNHWVDWNWEEAKPVFLAAIGHGVPIVGFEEFYESVFGKVSPHYAGRPSWAVKNVLPNTSGLYWSLKRAGDAVASAALLLLLSPLLAGAAALIALLDGSPVLFYQPRAGFMGRPFMVWKFRTMSVGAESSGPFSSARDNDARITRLGALLRRFRIDELPQLWNVLRGEMSLVGPRPEWMREVAVLERSVPSYHLRHLVYPGITGWAQVYFRATNSAKDSVEKAHFDLFYVKYLSFGLDMSILLKTIKRVCVCDRNIEPIRSPVIPATANTYWAGELAGELGG